MSELNYSVLVDGKSIRLHINLLKEYHSPAVACNVDVQYSGYKDKSSCLRPVRKALSLTVTAPESDEVVCNATLVQDTEESGDVPVTLQSCQAEALSDVALSDKLSDVSSDKPRVTRVKPHKIPLPRSQ